MNKVKKILSSTIFMSLSCLAFATNNDVDYSNQEIEYRLPISEDMSYMVLVDKLAGDNEYSCRIATRSLTQDNGGGALIFLKNCPFSENGNSIITSDVKPLLISTQENSYFLLWRKDNIYHYFTMNDQGVFRSAILSKIPSDKIITSMLVVGDKIFAFCKNGYILVSSGTDLITASWIPIATGVTGDFIDSAPNGDGFVAIAETTLSGLLQTQVISGNDHQIVSRRFLISNSVPLLPKRIIYNPYSSNAYKYVILTENPTSKQLDQQYKAFFYNPDNTISPPAVWLGPFQINNLIPRENGYIAFKKRDNKLMSLSFGLMDYQPIQTTTGNVLSVFRDRSFIQTNAAPIIIKEDSNDGNEKVCTLVKSENGLILQKGCSNLL